MQDAHLEPQIDMTQLSEPNSRVSCADSSPEAKALYEEVVAALKTVFDPEIPVNIYDLGLIYRIDVIDRRDIDIDMTSDGPRLPCRRRNGRNDEEGRRCSRRRRERKNQSGVRSAVAPKHDERRSQAGTGILRLSEPRASLGWPPASNDAFREHRHDIRNGACRRDMTPPSLFESFRHLLGHRGRHDRTHIRRRTQFFRLSRRTR